MTSHTQRGALRCERPWERRGGGLYKRGRRPPAGEFKLSRVQVSRRRATARTVARTAPSSRRGMIRSFRSVSFRSEDPGRGVVPVASTTVTPEGALIRNR